MLKQAENAARHFLEQPKSGNSGRQDVVTDMIADATLMTLGRAPSRQELAVLTGFISSEKPTDVKQWSSVFQALFASVDFRYID